ncbi:hypothetical protein SCLCIDRAFT_21256 [Scleroderma citrinum Foug A]|uniref:Uncharacterized protein n=1 Tax=Scleroderma citrinum Foug A TaxID=1036808 RepID=A0A0C3E3I0_9AGAM|nr:hypothetical protein SCLCIDRAFT_21256 [Scleroderma citrinum Foug A]
MSSGNNTDSGNNGNSADKINWQHIASPDLVEQVDNSLEVQIAKFDEQSCRQRDKLMKRAAEQEVQKKAEEERKKAEEEAKRAAEEEARRLAEEEAKKRAEFQAWWQADSERKAREKAEAKAAAEAMRAQIAQKVGQGEKPKPKPKQHQAASQRAPNDKVQGWYHPCDQCRKSGDSKGCVLPDNAHTPTCQQCQKMKVKCHFEVSTAMMKRSASGEKHKESETSATVVATSLQGGKKCKRTRRAVANVASTAEIEEALGGFSVAGPSTRPDPVAQMDRFAWEMKRMADHSDWKGKGRARPEETEKEEEKSDDGEDKEEADDVSDADAEGEDADE